ncbi:MAG: divalent-cation tolerance protein CutA [Panacagrimonas sp.]
MARAITRIVLVTCPPDHADELARALVEARVAACVNVVPKITSTYRWKDAVQRDDEALLIIKTTAGRFGELKRAVLERHPYELPEVLGVDVAAGHLPYLQWIAECVSPSPA